MTGQRSAPAPIRPRERDAILQSLRAGVVPRIGQQHIQVGRANEVTALLADIERIADGGSAIRFAIGEYGAGKSFFLNLIRSIALEPKTRHRARRPRPRPPSPRHRWSSKKPVRRTNAQRVHPGQA